MVPTVIAATASRRPTRPSFRKSIAKASATIDLLSWLLSQYQLKLLVANLQHLLMSVVIEFAASRVFNFIAFLI